MMKALDGLDMICCVLNVESESDNLLFRTLPT